MKYLKILAIVILLGIVSCLFLQDPVKAHKNNIGIEGADGITYDECIPDLSTFEGYGEKWYELVYYDGMMDHIDDDIDTIYYKMHLEEIKPEWQVSSSTIDDIKEGIERWNRISIYKEDEQGRLVVYPLMQFVDVDDLDDTTGIEINLDIHFEYSFVSGMDGANIIYDNSSLVEEDTVVVNGIRHQHYTKYNMTVNANNPINLDRTVAHELGHVFGLKDIDHIECDSFLDYHHQELLMGYSNPTIFYMNQYVSYRDLAGAMIARGLHTNEDHKWLYDMQSSTSTNHKLICSICNCVKYVEDLSDYEFDVYKACDNNHDLEDGNMMAVARYDNMDYWKCKYCRHTVEFGYNEQQNYTFKEFANNGQSHVLKNNIDGLEYELVENHNFSVDLGNNIYKCSSCPMCNDGQLRLPEAEEVVLECVMDSLNKPFTLNGDENKWYLLDIECISSYLIKVVANNQIHMEIFDENFNILPFNLETQNSGQTLLYNRSFPIGTYYLRIGLKDPTKVASVNLQLDSNLDFTPQYINVVHEYDIFEHMHNSTTQYIFENHADQIAKIVLDITNDNGEVVYPEGSIIIKDENKNIVNCFALLPNYNKPAISSMGQNSIIAYLEAGVDYTIEVNYSPDNATTGYVSIQFVDQINYDVFDSNYIDLYDNVTPSVDNLKSIQVNQSGKYQIDAKLTALGDEEIQFVILTAERDQNDNLQYVIVSSMSMGIANDTFSYSSNMLDSKKYLIGFLGADLEGTVEVTLKRLIENENATFITDPDVYTPCGTEVTINGGIRRGNRITEGFNRLAYFENAPSLSRLDYYWYSSNEDLLTVSIYGTIQALSVMENQEVTIMAVYKYDMSKVFRKTFQVLNDGKIGLQMIEYNVTLQKNGLWSVAPDENWPSPIIQNYNWYTNNDDVAIVNIWGIINAIDSGEATIYGDYKYNYRFMIAVNVIVI